MTKASIYHVELLFEQKTDVDTVLFLMQKLMDRYGYAALSDLYDLVGLRTNHSDASLGWNQKDIPEIIEANNGWVLRLPPPKPISELV